MTEANLQGLVPVLGIGSRDGAVDFYVSWLGFALDWEWREAPGRPSIIAISRDGIGMMLNEAVPARDAWLTLKVRDLRALAEEWNGRRPSSAEIIIEPPYEIPTVMLTDPFGNRLHFAQPVDAEEERRRRERAERMRALVRERLDRGDGCPTPAELVAAIGPPVGLAMDVLCEFPEYDPDRAR